MDKSLYPHQRCKPSHVGGQQARALAKIDTPSLRHINSDGSVSIKSNGRLYVKPAPNIEDKQSVIELSRLAWMAEGIVITPRTAENPLGWGLPPTEDGKGTVGGDFAIVVLNKYANNNTPEYLHTVYSDKPSFTDSEIKMRLNWPVNYINFVMSKPKDLLGEPKKDDAGAYKNDSYLPQFIARYVPLLSERRQDSWYCHRPKVRDWSLQYYKDCHEVIDNIRLAAPTPRPPFSKPLEGWTADYAQAACFVGAIAKKFAHNDASFSAGWQTFIDRVRGRGGFAGAAGEVLYAASKETKDFGTEAALWWKDSPPHYAAITNDYTQGSREDLGSAGLPQQSCEALTLGTFTKTNLGLDKRMKEMAAVMVGEPKRTPMTITWRHSTLGCISVLGAPAEMGMITLSNMYPSAVQHIGYRQTRIAAESSPHEDGTKAIVRGAALRVVAGERRMTDEQFNSLLFRKRKRDTAYNAARVAAGKTVDSAIVGAENALLPEQTGWDVQMRTLSVEYTNDNDVVLLMYGGKANDFMNTKAVMCRVPVPFEVSTVGMSAQFSKSGNKCVFPVGELLKPPIGALDAGMWEGEKIHFYELCDDGSFSVVGTSEASISAVDDGEGFSQYSASGECKLHGFYDGDVLRWVNLKFDHSAAHDSNVGGVSRRQLRSSIEVGGAEWVFCDTNSGGVAGSIDGAVNGFVRHILYFDPMHLDRLVWVDFACTAGGVNETKIDAVIYKNAISPVAVKTIYSDKSVIAQGRSAPFLAPMYAYKHGSNYTAQFVHPANPLADQPREDFKAGFWHGTLGLDRPCYGIRPDNQRIQCTPFAPVVFSARVGLPDVLMGGFCMDGYVVGGYLRTQPFGVGAKSTPVGNGLFFHCSNLNLEQLTGISGLADNVLPIWSM